MSQYLLSNADIDAMLANNNKTSNNNNMTTTKEKELVADLESLTTQFESVSATLQSNTNLYNSTLSTYTNQIQALQTQLNQTQSQLAQSQSLLQESLHHVDELEQQSQLYYDTLKEKAEEELKQKKVESIMESLRSDVVKKEEVIQNLNFTMQRLQSKYDILEQEKKSAEDTVVAPTASDDSASINNNEVSNKEQLQKYEQEKRDLFIEREKFRRLYNQQIQKEETEKMQEKAEFQALVETIVKLEQQMDVYEKERGSMRKLMGLGLKRFGSILAFWTWFRSSGGDSGDDGKDGEDVVVGPKKDIVDAKDGGGI